MFVKHFVDGINQTFQRLGVDFFLQLLQIYNCCSFCHKKSAKKKNYQINVLNFFFRFFLGNLNEDVIKMKIPLAFFIDNSIQF